MRGCTYTLIFVNYVLSIVMLCLKLIPKASSSSDSSDTSEWNFIIPFKSYLQSLIT